MLFSKRLNGENLKKTFALFTIYYFGSSLTKTGSSSMLELLETIGNSGYRVFPEFPIVSSSSRSILK